MHRLF